MLGKFTANCTIGGGRKRRICAICTSALLTALIIAFAALALPIRASAEPIVYNDSNGITYTLTENGDNTYKMTVSGSGGMEDFVFQLNPSDYTVTITSPYDSYRQNITEVVIDSGITHIGDYAFYNFKSLAAVSIPTTVKTIGLAAFSSCGLASVTIPEGVETINDGAFANCKALISIDFPSTLTSLGRGGTVRDCTALDRIIYKSGLDVSSAEIPAAATKVEYTASGVLTITNIILGTGKTAVEIPQTVNGMTVAPIADQELMKKVSHTHTGGAATCTQKAVCTLCGLEYGELLPHTGGTASCTAKAVCDVCGNEYGDLAAHNFVNGVCTVCNAADPNYTQPTETTSPTVTEPTGTAPTSPTGTAPSTPSRPSNPAPAVTTTVTTVTTVTTTTAEEEIIGEDYTGEDISVDAAVRAEEKEIGGRAFGAALVYITIFAGLAIAVKKLRPEK